MESYAYQQEGETGIVYTDKFTRTHKWCNHCEEMLLHERFSRNVASHTGLQGYCKEWNRQYAEERRRKNENVRVVPLAL